MKPHKGRIERWVKIPFDKSKYPDLGETMGYVIGGNPHGHPNFTNWIRTSAVVRHKGNEIETLNSRYTLGTPA